MLRTEGSPFTDKTLITMLKGHDAASRKSAKVHLSLLKTKGTVQHNCQAKIEVLQNIKETEAVMIAGKETFIN